MTTGPQLPLPPALHTVRDCVIIKDRPYLIDRPCNFDLQHFQSLKDLGSVSALAPTADDHLPYWAALWPTARMLSQVIADEPWTPGTKALEIGCGLGLPGIVALSVGLHVTFSDYDATALRFAADNARLNGFGDFKTLCLDWRDPPHDLQVPVLLASDLVYEISNVAPLVNFVKKALVPGGLCLLTDQDRLPSKTLREALADKGLPFTTRIVRAGEPGQKRVKGTLYRIQTSHHTP